MGPPNRFCILSEVSLNSGAVHVVAKYRGRTLHDVKHDICKVNADTFGCPMKRGINYTVLLQITY